MRRASSTIRILDVPSAPLPGCVRRAGTLVVTGLLALSSAAAAQKPAATPAEFAADMLRARQSVASTADGLRRTYRQTNEALIATLVQAGYGAHDVAGQMISKDGVAPDQTARWLLAARTPARQAFDAVARHARGDLDRVAQAVLEKVDLRDDATRATWIGTLRQSGFTAVQVVGVVGAYVPRTAAQRAAELHAAGYDAVQIATALKDDGASNSSIFAALQAIDVDAREAAEAARDALAMDAGAAAAALLAAKYDAIEAARGVDETYDPDPTEIAIPLRIAGTVASVVLTIVVVVLTGGALAAAAIPVATLISAVAVLAAAGFGSTEIAEALKEQGVSAQNAAHALLESSAAGLAETADALNDVFQLDHAQTATTLHDAGASWDEILRALHESAGLSSEALIAVFMELNIQDANAHAVLFEILAAAADATNAEKAWWLAQAGMSADRIAQGFMTAGLTAQAVAEALVAAGFTSATTVATALKNAGVASALTLAQALEAAGFDMVATQAALLALFQLTLQQVQQILATVFGGTGP
jgi:hypothetical protein